MNGQKILNNAITLTRKEAQQVLDALKWFEQRFACTHLELIDTIRARLSAPEPDAPTPRDQYCYERGYQRALEVMRQTPQREWQGLTDEEIRELEQHYLFGGIEFGDDIGYWAVYRAIEAKLRGKNS
jgi:hypothetical protein